MELHFINSEHRRIPTLVQRNDGVELSVPVFGPLAPIPNDLAHFVVESELRLQGGFWGSVAAGAVFPGMKIVAGRQRPHARERSEEIMKANHREILLSEGLVAAALGIHEGTTSINELRPMVYAGKAFTREAQTDALARLRTPIEEMCARWAATPPGGTLTVTWPEQQVRATHGGRRHAS